MKGYVDLNLRAPTENIQQTQEMINKATQLGYSHIAIPLPPNVATQQISQLKHFCKESKADFITRVNLVPRNANELLHDLRRLRRKFEIVAVRCNTKDVARQAARDRRVDLLQFSVTNLRQRFFDESETELASQALSSLEIEVAPILQLTSFSRVKLLGRLRKEVATAQRAKVPVTLSSGATAPHLLRSARDYATLATLFDLCSPSALKALSETPLGLVERNRKKLSPNYVAPGIRVVGRKET
jgi:RNase P/RNase MRP subunit p30